MKTILLSFLAACGIAVAAPEAPVNPPSTGLADQSGKFLDPRNAGLLCSGTCCPVAPAAPAAPAVIPAAVGDISPIQQAQAQLVSDIAAYSTTAGSLAAAQGQLAGLQATIATLTTSANAAQAAVASDLATLQSLINIKPGPQPTPGPVQHVLSVVMVEGAGCPPCIKMDPIIDKLAAAGQPVTRTTTDKWGVSATPCFVVTIDGQEVQRSVGAMKEQELIDWIASIKEWVTKKYPAKG